VIKQDISENQAKIVFLGIGSNLGNKKINLDKTKYLLQKNSIKILKISNVYETYAWPNKNHPKFFNIVIKVLTKLNPIKLFNKIKKIEKKLGRKISKINSPRVCDIDILDYNNKCYNLTSKNHSIIIPHPRISKRNFVLFPLYEIERNWIHPQNKTKIQDLIKNLDYFSLYTIKQI
tara:strand:+ start:201 stop:728 length:528 start_codon:yes stop_codon:yes gene_type:complete